MDQLVELVHLLFEDLNAELAEMPTSRGVVGVRLQDHLEDLESFLDVPTSGGRSVFAKKRTVLRNFLIVEAIEQIHVILRPIGSEV